MKKSLKLFLTTIYMCSLFLFLYLYQVQRGSLLTTEVIFFLAALLITKNISYIFNIKTGITISIILPILIPSIIMLDPFWVAVVAAVGSSKLFFKKKFIWYQFLFNRSMFFLAAGTASLIFHYTKGIYQLPFFTLPLLFALLAYFLINTGLVYLVVRLAEGKQQETTVLLYFSQLAKNLITSYFLGITLYFCYITFGKVFFALSIVLIYVLKDFLFSRIQQLNSFTQIVEGFLKVIDSKDHYTEGHCERVAIYTEMLCKELNLRRWKIDRIVNMAKIHDIGKISVDDAILKSSGYLTDIEYEEMKKHSLYGYQVLKDIDLLKDDLDIILHHHENYDGTGYPTGKKGKEIPIGARILNICDAFDVMATGRSYKPAMSKEQVINELDKCSGAQFDPTIVVAMIRLLDNGRLDEFFKEEYNQEITINLEASLN